MKLINHRRLACLLLAVFLLSQMASAAAEAYPYTAYATDSVRLRGGPSSSADVLAAIRKGDAVAVSGTDGSYRVVEYEGKKGYVVSSFLSAETSPDESLALPEPVAASQYRLLTNGSEGAQVKALQQALQELGYYEKTIDSKFGSGTGQAVSAFQEKNSLGVTGDADPVSQSLLFEGEPVNSRGVKVQVQTLPPIPGVTMRPGDRGDAVVSMQQKLKTLHLYSGQPDGVYNSETESAVRAFQKVNNLTADGIAGEKTQAQLAQAILQPSSSQQTPAQIGETTIYNPQEEPAAVYPYTTTAAASVNLRKRASTSAMRLITIPQGASLEVLEDTGSYLKASYRGYTGYAMKDFINVPEQYLTGKVLDMNTDARVKYETLTVGAEGRKVRALQQALSELGFYGNQVDGKFGAGTTAALKAFQKKNNLRETGIALPELQQLLFEQRVRSSRGSLVLVKTLPPVDGLTLAQGDYGDAVYELHQMLMKSGHYDSTVGYEFTRATALAVSAFQKDHSIKVTGKADSFTMLALKTNLSVQSPGPGSDLPVQTPPTEDNVTVVRSGTRGMAVNRLQSRLVELGYYSITPDGEFNGDDIAALRQFQRVNGLEIDGIAGLATQQTLYASYALRADAQAVPFTPAPPSGNALKLGSSGNDVRAMQSRLITLKYLTGTADGIFGTQTAAAVTSFQRTNNLGADGIAGDQTISVLYSAGAKAYTQPQEPAPQPGSTQKVALEIGDTGSVVAAMQLKLIALRYLTGSADGMFGPSTFLAVKTFQEKNKLEADGIAGSLTLAKLDSSSAVANNGVIMPQVTPAPQPQQPAAPAFAKPKASEVRFANWYTEIRPIAQRLRNVIVYDIESGKHYNFRLFSLGKHADGTTVTKDDTAVMNSVLGMNNWTPRPVWVIFSDGRVYMASTHSHGHETDYIAGNELTGHLCIHFPREMEEAALTGPYAVSHQNAILAGWDLTQNMAK